MQRSGVQHERAGVDEIRDATGHVIATNTRYTEKEIHWTEHDWYGMQGGVRIDDESFFRIAGDDKAVECLFTRAETLLRMRRRKLRRGPMRRRRPMRKRRSSTERMREVAWEEAFARPRICLPQPALPKADRDFFYLVRRR